MFVGGLFFCFHHFDEIACDVVSNRTRYLKIRSGGKRGGGGAIRGKNIQEKAGTISGG